MWYNNSRKWAISRMIRLPRESMHFPLSLLCLPSIFGDDVVFTHKLELMLLALLTIVSKLTHAHTDWQTLSLCTVVYEIRGAFVNHVYLLKMILWMKWRHSLRLGKNGLVYAHILQMKNLQMKIHTGIQGRARARTNTHIYLHTWSKKKLLKWKAIGTHTRKQCVWLLLVVGAAAAVIALENMQDIRFTEWKCP